ncbi:MAG: tetratricopeptide repeat protein [bacterium]|nr:tetratricopeptide repeat protein [bacterium]
MEPREYTSKEIELYTEGVKAIDSGNYKTALKLNDSLLEINPKNPIYYLMRSEYYDAMYDFDECITCLEKAWEHRDKGYFSDEYVKILQKDIANLKRRRQTPKEAEHYENLEKAIDAEDYPNALLLAEGLLEVKKYHPLYHYLLGHCQRQLNQFDEALKSYREALKYGRTIYPMEDSFNEVVTREINEISLSQSNWAAFSEDGYGDAIAIIDKQLELRPDSGEFYFLRGLCNEALEYFESATKDYKTALKYGLDNEELKRIAEEKVKPKTETYSISPLTVFMEEKEIRDGVFEMVPQDMPNWDDTFFIGLDENEKLRISTLQDLMEWQKKNPDIEYTFPYFVVDSKAKTVKQPIAYIRKSLTKKQQPETESQRKRRERNKRYYDKKVDEDRYNTPWHKYRHTHKAQIKVKNKLNYSIMKLDSSNTSDQQEQQDNLPDTTLPPKQD